jgi:hypothetical protein
MCAPEETASEFARQAAKAVVLKFINPPASIEDRFAGTGQHQAAVVDLRESHTNAFKQGHA